MELFNGDCLEKMKDFETDSVDLLFCDLPYCGITNSKKNSEIACKWNTPVDLELFWKEVNRVCKINAPMFFTCSTKFGVSLINSNPKNFRYDLVWVKSAPTGFLNAKKMPMKKHEMVYVFYRKLPFYNIADNHTHKFLKERTGRSGSIYGSNKKDLEIPSPVGKYDPPLPTSVMKEPEYGIMGRAEEPENEVVEPKNEDLYGVSNEYKIRPHKTNKSYYDPPIPNSILEVPSQKGKHPTQKPTALMEWVLKYYTRENDLVLDPTMGSGSTGVACQNMNRRFIGIEMDEKIFEDAKKRLIKN